MDVISALLQRSMLSALGEDESRVDLVRAAVADLGQSLRTQRRTLVPSAIIATFAASSTATDTVLVEAEQALMAQWQTYRNVHPAGAVELLKAVALAAVVDATDDQALAAAAWYSSRNTIDRISSGAWAEVLGELADRWAQSAITAAAAQWSPPAQSVDLRMPDVPGVDSDRITVNTDVRDLAAGLSRANYNTFASELMEHYSTHIDRLIAISEVASGAARTQANTQLREFSTALGKRIRAVLAAHDQEVHVTSLRTRLLWWRTSGYSERLDAAYADLPAAGAVIAAALDLHEAIPPLAPPSVEHVLAGLVAEATGSAEISLDELSGSEHALSLPPDDEAVAPATIALAARERAETVLLGRDEKITAAHASVLLFRDLQARRLGATAPPPAPTDAQ